jgi:hypothetical protein
MSHFRAIDSYYNAIYGCCYSAAKGIIPISTHGKSVAGWNEVARPIREKSLFWHHIWSEAGRPRCGVLADIMRQTRCRYHYAVRKLRKNDVLRKEAFAEALIRNDSRNYWDEVRKIKRSRRNLPSTIDLVSNNDGIAEVFANTYKDLYSSVQCSAEELNALSKIIDKRLLDDKLQSDHIVHYYEIIDAVHSLKANKHEGVRGLSSDFFINASVDLYIHLALLITAMLSHGHTPSQLSTSTIIPIPKGHNADKSLSCNYRAISLSSIVGKIIDLIIINRYSDKLVTSDNQFGFKPKSSTTVCTMLVKEAITYYHNNDNDVYCTLLDATKAFDRVNFSKPFDKLLHIKLPIVIVRLLFKMYTGLSACIFWNGVASSSFPVLNGVRQGGILSPILFCVYLDGLIARLTEAKIGCFIGHIYVGVFVYADDIAIIAPTPLAMRKMLDICDRYANEYSIKFNANKSKCLYFPSASCSHQADSNQLPLFTIAGDYIEYVDSWPHLGHILNTDFSDDPDIIHRHNATVRQINDVLCYFGKLDPVVKLRLLYSFCSSFYGCELWDLRRNKINMLCVSWRRALKNVWKLPMTTHSNIIYGLSGKPPIEVEFMFRCLKFNFQCMNSENHVVRNVVRQSVFVSGCFSLFGRNC